MQNNHKNWSSAAQTSRSRGMLKRMMLHSLLGDARMMLDDQVLRSQVCSWTHENQDLDPNL